MSAAVGGGRGGGCLEQAVPLAIRSQDVCLSLVDRDEPLVGLRDDRPGGAKEVVHRSGRVEVCRDWYLLTYNRKGPRPYGGPVWRVVRDSHATLPLLI